MRNINKKILHCSDTRIDQSFDIEDLRNWHTWPKPDQNRVRWRHKGYWYGSREDLPEELRNVQGNDWSDVGYHYYIKLNGVIQTGRQMDVPGAHTRGENDDSIGICFEGGKNPDGSIWIGPNEIQEQSFFELNHKIDKVVGRPVSVFAHNDFDKSKTCPSFSVPSLMSRYYEQNPKGSR